MVVMGLNPIKLGLSAISLFGKLVGLSVCQVVSLGLSAISLFGKLVLPPGTIVAVLGLSAISLVLYLRRIPLRPFHHHTLMTRLPVS